MPAAPTSAPGTRNLAAACHAVSMNLRLRAASQHERSDTQNWGIISNSHIPVRVRGLGFLFDQPKDLVTQFNRQNIHNIRAANTIFIGEFLDILLNFIAWIVIIADKIEA